MKKAARDLIVGDKTSTFEVMAIAKSEEPFVYCKVKLLGGGWETRRFHNSPNNLLNVSVQ